MYLRRENHWHIYFKWIWKRKHYEELNHKLSLIFKLKHMCLFNMLGSNLIKSNYFCYIT